MALQCKLVQLPTAWTMWLVATCVIFLTICASAFPVNYPEDYDGLYPEADAGDLAQILKEEQRRGGNVAAPLWFHRSGKAGSAPMWFNKFKRSENEVGEAAKTPPLWFHRAGRAPQVAAPMWFHRSGRAFQRPLSYKEKELIKDMLQKVEQRAEDEIN